MTALLLIADLAIATAATWPEHLDAEAATEHAWHAERGALEDEMVPADLLLAVAAAESSFDGTDITVACKNGKCNTFCGVGQTDSNNNRRRCLEMLQLSVGYQVLAAELAWWIKDQRGDLRRALAGHGCGYLDKAKRTTRLRCGERMATKRHRYKPPYIRRVLTGLRRLQLARAAREAGS